TAVKRELADAHLPLHTLAHDGERVSRDTAVRSEIVGAIDVHWIERRSVGKLDQVDHPRRLRPDLLEILVRHDDVAALLELEPLDDLRVRHLALAVRAPFFLLDASLTLTVQLVERDRPARLG